MDRDKAYILWFNQLHRDDVDLVGGKSSSLGELTSETNVPVPYGFATTATAYRHFMNYSDLNQKIDKLLATLTDPEDSEQLQEICTKIRRLIIEAPMPDDLALEISCAYDDLAQKMHQNEPFVAVRSSATAEDLPNASFAGEQDTYLNIHGRENVLRKVQECYASLFTDRATYYRIKQHFPQEKVALSAAIQMMAFSKAAGVMFTVNVATGDDTKVMIEASWGLGEYIVSGTVTPDNYIVDKNTMKIVHKMVTKKPIELIRLPSGGTIEQKVAPDKVDAPALTDAQIIELAGYAKEIEKHYGCYMDMEWSLDQDNKLWLVQARPETVWSQKKKQGEEEVTEEVTTDHQVLLKGLPASPGIVSGKVHIIDDPKDINEFKQGEILVTLMTSPDWVPAMKKAAAIITNNGGMTCHAAIVSREMQIPCLVGTTSRGLAATKALKNGETVTVDAKNGVVYAGIVKDVVKKVDKTSSKPVTTEYFPPTATRIMMNLGDPDLAEKYASLPADGIGLMREEFLWTTYIHQHPLYLIETGHPERVVNELANGIGKVARAMAPRPVVLRFSDFKSGEYRNLKGGDKYEPHEPADLLGWRGASRYYDPKYIAAFELELAAIKKVRHEFGLKNLQVMIPFCRTVDEARKVTEIMREHGLVRSADFKIYMMAEIPANIILADQFNQFVDGYSIGSNDLTMLLLGCDRNNDVISDLFDERNLAVKRAIRHLIKVAHQAGKTVSICGQAPSEYPEFTEFLVRSGIDYVSVNPDMVKTTKLNVAHYEQRILLDQATGLGKKDPADYNW
ncbi:MAG: phosphoenolpyruvate synthase [Lactobacillus crispatus]|jgi:pyruvate,water dikinase|uniref:phosphoenolpyruvate synthase n=1 Tax=Lactobacillus crispatus TaxID=47770 RepID=UPI0018AC29B7|nr:phosphoenolpyruvate synthase [Lactobacillus crispatus]MCH4004124.1 phosphoenolpyruvate synthase [Lactobacillus crispatus]MCI1335813.1 phosphoenolpyruvate synthase [Lactobacillus crispatus]MCI1365238.1 phosphoenolpyruvate synthase [Lactobacillus crispatus]MCI1493787.1 phosphoenolpyruvate synthase [Lactobacillus crispatus]MCI1524487.1 phosphoenolpyruvate synthase [Lactobacillus crispatus]